MRKLYVLLAAALLVASSQAGAFVITGSSLSLSVGALPAITTGVNGGGSVAGTAASFTIPAATAGPTTVSLVPSLFTGVPSISGLTVVGLANPGLSMVGGSGAGPVGGTVFVNVLQFASLPIPLSVVGVTTGATTAMASLGAIIITVVGGGNGWTTGVAAVTGIVTTTPGTAVINTVSATGAGLTAAGVTVITGFKAITSVGFILPGFVTLTLVPEPGTLMLLGSGVLGLALLGRRRARK